MSTIQTIFRVFGPRVIPTYRGKAGRTITDAEVRTFWTSNADIGDMRGCYVFGLRASRGTKPVYVGRATKSFRQEVFQYHKLTRYLQALAEHRTETPILFFLALPRRRGAPATSHVVELERFLIANAADENPALLNLRCRPTRAWTVTGAGRNRGRPSESSRALQTLMKLA